MEAQAPVVKKRVIKIKKSSKVTNQQEPEKQSEQPVVA